MIASLSLTLFQQAPAIAADIQVSVFNQSGLNGSGCAGENENLIGIINAIDGYAVDGTITDFIDGAGQPTLATQLASSTFFFMTDMENQNPSLESFFPTSAKTAIKDWTFNGGVMVMTGTHGSYDTTFLNSIYSWDLTNQTHNTSTEITANTAGTPFANATGGVSLTQSNATESIGRGTVQNFTAMWTTNGNSTGNAEVAVIQYGAGTVIYMGWDFYAAGPTCAAYSDPWVQDIVPAALQSASQLSGASALTNLTTSGGDLGYTVSQNGTAYCIVVASGSTAPTAAQVKAGVDYTGGTKLYANNLSVTSNVSSTFSISGLAQSTDYVAYVVTEYGSPAQYSTITSTSFSTKPGVPAVSSVSAGNAQVSVSITAASTETNFQYSIDSGSNWVTRSPVAVTSPWTISGLTNGTSYTFLFRSIYKGQSGASTSSFTATPRILTVASAPVVSSISSSDASLSVSFTAPTDNGGSVVSNYKYSTDGTNYFAFSPAQTTSPLTIRYLSTDGTTALVNGTSYPITLKAVNTTGDSSASNSVSGTPAIPSSSGGSSGGSPAAPTPTITPTPTATSRSNQTSSRVLTAPVITGNRNPQSLLNPTAIIGGVPTTTTTRVIDQNKLNILAGQLSLEVKVADKQGSVGKSNSGDTELQVKKGGLATISGNGVRPLSTVQVFLPLQGSNSKEIGRITATNIGSFSGEALFATAIKEAPLPIGRQILQIVSLDKSGNQSVVDMPVNIAQPAPAPEQNRQSGLLPNQTFGTSFATSAGLPIKVVIEALEQDNKAIVQGDSWSMSIDVPDTNGKVSKSGETAQLKFVQNKSVFVSGTGFLPNTRADIWLFSDPTLLGSVDIDQDGNFSGEIEAASNFVPVGEHTLQVQGVGDDGFVRSANLGVLVEAGSPSTLNGSIPLWAYATTAAGLLTVFWFFVIKRRKEDEPKHIR